MVKGTAAFAIVAMSIVARAQQPTPAVADENLTLRDHHFKLSAPVPGGRSTWHVRNEGTEPHQALIVQLPEDVHEYAERTWFTSGSRGEEPGRPVGGVQRLEPGRDAWFTVALEPGRYLLLCTMTEDEGRHFDLGMIYRFTIE
jgi:hypothetical protein